MAQTRTRNTMTLYFISNTTLLGNTHGVTAIFREEEPTSTIEVTASNSNSISTRSVSCQNQPGVAVVSRSTHPNARLPSTSTGRGAVSTTNNETNIWIINVINRVDQCFIWNVHLYLILT